MDELLAARSRINQTSTDFLKIDLETALTFTQIARTASNEERKKRNSSAAKKAYHTIVRLGKKIDMSTQDQRIVTQGLQQLKLELEALGIAV